MVFFFLWLYVWLIFFLPFSVWLNWGKERFGLGLWGFEGEEEEELEGGEG